MTRRVLCATLAGAALLSIATSFAAGEPDPKHCTVKLNSSFTMTAPPGWRVVECSTEVKDQSRVFALEPVDVASTPPAAGEPAPLVIYGGNVGRTLVEGFLAEDRESHSAEFVPKDGDGLRTSDGRDLRVLELTRREPPYMWAAHALLKSGPTVFWVVVECRQQERCPASYTAFKRLVASLEVSTPNEVDRGR
jgi:hypothetical protein